MLKPALFALTFAAANLATAADAANLDIIFEDGGFYPEITYLQPGDTATIYNGTTTDVVVEATDQSWTSGTLIEEASFVLTMSDSTVLTYTVSDNVDIAGFLSFAPAPLSGLTSDDYGEGGYISTN